MSNMDRLSKEHPSARLVVAGFHEVSFTVTSSSQYPTNPDIRGFFVIIWWNMAQQMSQNFLYYLVLLFSYLHSKRVTKSSIQMGTLTNDINELTRLTGILRGSESAAQAIAYGINA